MIYSDGGYIHLYEWQLKSNEKTYYTCMQTVTSEVYENCLYVTTNIPRTEQLLLSGKE